MIECDWCDNNDDVAVDPATDTLMCEDCRADLARGLEAGFVEIERLQR